jgi:hypothetical protein
MLRLISKHVFSVAKPQGAILFGSAILFAASILFAQKGHAKIKNRGFIMVFNKFKICVKGQNCLPPQFFGCKNQFLKRKKFKLFFKSFFSNTLLFVSKERV